MTDPNGWAADKPNVPMNTDGASADVVLAAVARCAASWVPEARIIGNVRAGDILRALAEVAAREAAAELRGRIDGCTLRPELPLEALPPPTGHDALTRRIAEAEARGMKRAAGIAEAAIDVDGACTETVGMIVRAIRFAVDHPALRARAAQEKQP